MKKTVTALSLVLALGLLSSCSGLVDEISDLDMAESSTSATDSSTPPDSDSSTTEQSTADDKIGTAQNPLTGELGYNEAALGKRPVAVMINNVKISLPQYGVEQADIVYEMLVEGGITRLMAVYADYTNMPDICSVRSCRYYYPIVAYGMDAMYAHMGIEETFAQKTVDRLGIDRLDGSSNKTFNLMFYRDKERQKTYAIEHTAAITGSNVAKTIEELKLRSDIREENKGNMFNFADTKINPGEKTANKCVLNFSTSYFSTFEYDSSTGKYLKNHNKNPHIDANTKNQLAFTNIFILKTKVRPKPEDTYLVDVELKGGSGWYISNGFAQEIKWSKADEKSPMVFTDAQGGELNVNTGKSYIGIIGDTLAVTIG